MSPDEDNDMGDDLAVPLPFIVFSLPRSRSAWMTHFLSYPPFQCGHDMATYCESVSDFLGMFASGMVGTCETGAVEAWRVIRAEMPECKFVVVRRPLPDVLASFARHGLSPDEAQLIQRANLLESVASLAGTLVLDYSELDGYLGCRRLFEFCLGLPFDWAWWEFYSQYNIQVDLRAQLELCRVNAPGLARLRDEVALRNQALGQLKEFN